MLDVPAPQIAPEEPQILAGWEAPVLPRHERSKKWYTVNGIVVLVFAAYGILSGSWPFAIVVLLCGAMYYLMRDHVPSLQTIIITDKGVQLGETFTRWEDLSGFWLLETPLYTELHFIPVLKRRGEMLIQTGDQNNENLRQLIGARIPELTDKREGFLDALLRTAKL